MSSLKEDIETSIRTLKLQGIPQGFIIDTLERVLAQHYRETRIHSCDIPGCMSCGNPESPSDWDYYMESKEEEDA